MSSTSRDSETDFITIEFLESVLKTTVSSFTVNPGSNVGDNYTSILHAIEIKQEGMANPTHLLMKTYPKDIARQQFLEELKVFRKELRVYDTLIPELTKFAEKQSLRDGGKTPALKPSVPTLVHGVVSADVSDAQEGAEVGQVSLLDNYILMVDLRRTFGFRMADRRTGLDFDHCSLVITELAKFHALNWAYRVNNGLKSMKERFPFFDDVFYKNKEMIKRMVKGNFEMLRPILEEALGFDSEAVKGFNRISNDSMENFFLFIQEDKPIDEEQISRLLRVKAKHDGCGIIPEPDFRPWMVGNHGDCWVNNMLFKYDEETGKPVQNVLLDLQVVREACPTIDLAYFFYSSTTHLTRATHLNTLFDLYAEKFQTFCQELNAKPFPGFSSAELKRRFHRSKLYGLFTAVMILPVIIQSQDAAVDLEKIVVDDTKDEMEKEAILNVMKEICKGGNPMLTDRIVGLVKELYHDGII